ncbi:isoleucine--tRNA ligase [Curtobacterium sp. MCLR17_007]|uniref:isoleucine--tRNA ligase n=1 Tax=Curtobacterium sp. MCLR17_007 TaxID=2175648 RepID=UPI000DA8E3B5|nr:isoleucine--tRNA ligase [Curtobacterium sp. MCLR17_007]WIB61293.1 isoleucine--tRNA ligase [Curtobacterium sp. MCLR17_007]
MRYPLHRDADDAAGVTPSPSFPAVEQGILAFWKRDDTFQASIDARQGCDEWVFYDGPPFANGLPHYGHLLTGYAKDVFPRYQTMRGKQVHRRFGWDTHGLPAELEAMRQLGITEKHEIDEMGVDVFNAAAKKSVLQYTDEWQQYVTRQARWVDFEDDYKTLDVTYMESVLWAWKQLWDKGLAYEGFRVLPYCWNDQTPLSNHELRMDDDVYQMRQDQSVTVSFPLRGARAAELGLDGVRALAWTTTPWTLPTNAALAVGPAVSYVVLPAGPAGSADGADAGSVSYMLAADTVAAYAKDLGYASPDDAVAAVTRTLVGTELDGVEYERLFDFLADAEGMENAWQILVADYVETGEGTGIVHQAPAYGADDQEVCAAAGIPVVLSLDEGGVFTSQFPLVAGQLWSDANKPLTKAVRDAGRLLRQASYEHSYPHCWRCRKPLIYKAVSSWFVRVTEFRDRMGELNQDINWVPDNVKDGQFGKWVGNAIDWSVSRNRYFGTPIPVWVSDDPEHPRTDVYGSLAEIERDFGRLPVNADGEVDLHRPFIDELTRPNPDDPTGGSTMRRISDVFDVWFDSGSMPYAQVHYPFENREWFDTHSPADFIVEYIGQTRGWFYVMHALSTALFDRPAFTNVVSHGIVLGSDGQKMSKSLRNYPDVSEVFDRDGADAMRWFLMSSSVIRGGNLVVTEEGIRQGVREFLLPFWSTYYFFTLYANASGPEGHQASRRTDSTDVLDRYLLAKTRLLVTDVTTHLDALDTPLAAQAIRDFADVLTNWYVRRSRDKFWLGAASSESARAAFDTLYTALETLARVAAPLAPLVSEEVWKGLTGGRSVHLTDFPSADEFPADDALVAAMDRVRDVASKGLALRKATGKRVRLPLATLTLVVPDTAAVEPFVDILRDELNVKRVVLEPQAEESLAQYGIERKLAVNARAAGPRIGKAVQQVIPAAKRGDWVATESGVTVGGIDLVEGEYTLDLTVADASTAVAFLDGGGFVVLDTDTTPELEAEGLARDVVRAVQQARRDADLDVSDRIVLTLGTDEGAADAVRTHRELIAGETLATTVDVVTTTFGKDEGTAVGDGAKVTVEVARA